jgi:hypothetical protein
MVEADIYLRMVPTSIADIHNMFELLVCCLTDNGSTLIPLYRPSWPQILEFGSIVDSK